MRVLLSLSLVAAGLPAAANGHRAMTPRDVIELKQVSDPQISPDGARVVFVVAELDAKAGVASFAWAPDGKTIAYLAPDPPSEDEEKKTKADKWVLGEGK